MVKKKEPQEKTGQMKSPGELWPSCEYECTPKSAINSILIDCTICYYRGDALRLTVVEKEVKDQE